jgi:hypothetical protein
LRVKGVATVPPHPVDALRSIVLVLLALLVCGPSDPGFADDGCFFERGRLLIPNATDVAVSGHLVVTLQQSGWSTRPVVRVAELRRNGPVEVGRWEATWGVEDVHVKASTAIVAADFGLVSLDLRDPAYPTELDFIDLNGTEHLAVDGGMAYIATTGVGGNGWFDVAEVDDPSDLQRLGQLHWGRPDTVKRAVDAADGVAVIADSSGLLIIDVGDPWRPSEAGRWVREGVRDVVLIGDLAAAAITSFANDNDTGVSLVDLSESGAPVLVGAWQSPSGVRAVAEYGGGILAGTEENGLFLLDISNPAEPTVADHWFDPELRVDHIGTAWPTIVLSGFDAGTVVLGLRPPCLPPRRPAGRIGP